MQTQLHSRDFSRLEELLASTINGISPTREPHILLLHHSRTLPRQQPRRVGQHLRVRAKSLSRHPLQDPNSPSISKIYYFYYKFSDYIHPNTNLVTSNKSNTRSITCLCLPFERKNRYTFRHNVHSSILKITLKQIIHHFQEDHDTENSQKDALNQRSCLKL